MLKNTRNFFAPDGNMYGLGGINFDRITTVDLIHIPKINDETLKDELNNLISHVRNFAIKDGELYAVDSEDLHNITAHNVYLKPETIYIKTLINRTIEDLFKTVSLYKPKCLIGKFISSFDDVSEYKETIDTMRPADKPKVKLRIPNFTIEDLLNLKEGSDIRIEGEDLVVYELVPHYDFINEITIDKVYIGKLFIYYGENE